MVAGGRARAPRRARRCPICRAPSAAAFDPFCSGRCADIDLGHWLAGDYRIPASESGGADDAEDAGADEPPSAADEDRGSSGRSG
ncbi:MAG: DNA gyrase inhibitor YacG [Rhodospirillales bacterium]|nr:DNA gyrase inhibitor YacG [Rhodospirillales bacterium]